MRMAFARCGKALLTTAASVVMLQATAARAQHASDNPVTAAQDAYGLTLGLESVGMYSPGLVRGFSPQVAGNIRVDGLYFDQQGLLSNRVVEGSTIRVGVSEIGYSFPAPTGIVDYDLRHPGGDTPNATIITNIGPYDAWGVSIDGSVPVVDKELVLPVGVSYQVSTQSPYGSYPHLTSLVTSAGATPQWKPNDKITVRALLDWQQTRDARTLPLYFTAGDFLPPTISNGYLGQNWAEGKSVTMNLGGIVSAKLTDAWSLKAGIFRSINDSPSGFADLYTDIQPGGQSEHLVVGYPDQRTSSNSGEVRLTGSFTAGDWRQQVIFMARGRDTTARYGGEDTVDVGPTVIGTGIQVPEPDFLYSARSLDHAELWSAGAAYHVYWRGLAELETGIQQESYDETVTSPAASQSGTAAHPRRVYANAASAVTPQLTLYAGYTQGLENSGVAPNFAANSGAVLPASLTWQVDSGARYAVTPDLKIIAGVFELQKPYFNLNGNNVDRQLGAQQARGIEISIAGEPIAHLHVNVGVLIDKVGISGSDLAAEGVGPIAVGQPRLTYVANANYAFPWWPAASVDISATHFGSEPESVDNGIYTPAVTQVNLGARYKFTVFGQNNTLRLQVQNVFNSSWWTNVYTPGFFEWPGPRTVFVYLTTDLQG
jgi:iron complex outermembrane recepter protein